MREAAAAAESERSAGDGGQDDVACRMETSAAMEKALALLAQALAGPQTQKYRVSSHSRPGLSYDLQVDAGGDVTCTCPGFEYGGLCSHARELKGALGKGKGVPGGYEAVA